MEGFLSKRNSGGQTAESPAPPEIVCILVVDTMFDEFEVEICCQRAEGVEFPRARIAAICSMKILTAKLDPGNPPLTEIWLTRKNAE